MNAQFNAMKLIYFNKYSNLNMVSYRVTWGKSE